MEKIEQLYQYFLKSSGVTTDTRQNVKNKVFFALSGENFNGNKFARQALDNGALLAVIDDPSYNVNNQCFLVENVLTQLQNLALYHRKHIDIPVIGITGTNGKTTTKELVATVLESKYNIIATRGNFNNHIGVPLTLLRLTKKTEIAVVEMGANHIGEIDFLTKIALPTHGLITNISKAHLEGFGNLEGVVKAKSELFDFIKTNHGTVFVNSNDQLLMSLSKDINRFNYGSNNVPITGKLVKHFPFIAVEIKTVEETFTISTQLYGGYNLPNILAAATVGYFFSVPTQSIKQSIENYIPKNNRSQQLITNHNRIILDAYNANPISLSNAINTFVDACFENPFFIIGDMLELGSTSTEEHQNIVDLLIKTGFKDVILIGKEFFKTNHPFKAYKSKEDAAAYLKNQPVINKTILIKGSNGMHLKSLLGYL